MTVDLAALLAGLAGFLALALAMEKHGRQLLSRPPGAGARFGLRVAGWALLALALYLSMRHRLWTAATVVWLQALAVVGVALIFRLSKWARRSDTPERPGRAPPPSAPADAPEGRRAVRLAKAVLLLVLPVGFLALLYAAPPKPVLRGDAINGRVGPWTFSLAEIDDKPPVVEALDTPLKAFQLRFCEACDEQVARAFLKIREPRSLRSSGVGFEGDRWNRTVEIGIPPAARAGDGLWLTVEGKDGGVHRVALDIARISPATARFMETRQ